MGLLLRENFPLGWQPSADSRTAPKGCLLRGDNLVWDEVGRLALRSGSQTINANAAGVPVPLVGATSSVHSLFTTTINGTRYRITGVDSQAFANGGSFASFAGSGDIRFGAHQAQILAARSTDRWKWDGTNTRRWGIPAPTSAPTLQLLEPRVIEVSSFASGETPAWVVTEGTVTDGIGQDGSGAGARDMFPPAITGRGTIQRTFASAADYNSFDSGAATGALEDSIEFYAWISNPELLEYIAISFDVNQDSENPFQDDYYYFEFTPVDATEVKLDDKDLLRDRPDVEGIDRDDFFDAHEGKRAPFVSRVRRDAPSDNAGWSKFIVLRGQMERIGSTPGADWSTVKAVRFTVKYRATESTTNTGHARIDGLRILGGSDRTLTGKFSGRFIWTRDFGGYIAKSGPSPISSEIECRNNGIRMVIAAATSNAKDSQVNETGGEAWGYLAGGGLRSFFRFQTVAAQPGQMAMNCTISERSAIITGLLLNTDDGEPPENIIAIVGPYKQRTVVCTAKQVSIGRAGNPDTFGADQVLDLADPGETILWAFMSRQEILIGTTRDVYVLAGSLSELPDGTMDARLDNLGVNSPPISDFVVNDGSFAVYMGADGFRMLEGAASRSINWNIDLLVQGKVRHGVSPLNLGSAPGRFRGGIFNGRIYVLVCEGAAVSASNVLYVADLSERRWRRAQYPRSFQALYREPDGKVLAGDSSGCVWQLEVDTGAGDMFGTTPIPIPVVLWTPSDDNGDPLRFKVPYDWRTEVVTGAETATIEVYLDDVLRDSFSAQNTAWGVRQEPLGDPNDEDKRCKRIQTKVTGAFTEFAMGPLAVTYRDCPTPMAYWDSSLLDFGTQDLVWFRELQIKARSPVTVKARIFFDGVERILPNNGEIEIVPDVVSIYPIDIGRECKGKVPLVVLMPLDPGPISDPNLFELYWLRTRQRVSGGFTEKTYKITAGM